MFGCDFSAEFRSEQSDPLLLLFVSAAAKRTFKSAYKWECLRISLMFVRFSKKEYLESTFFHLCYFYCCSFMLLHRSLLQFCFSSLFLFSSHLLLLLFYLSTCILRLRSLVVFRRVVRTNQAMKVMQRFVRNPFWDGTPRGGLRRRWEERVDEAEQISVRTLLTKSHSITDIEARWGKGYALFCWAFASPLPFFSSFHFATASMSAFLLSLLLMLLFSSFSLRFLFSSLLFSSPLVFIPL